MTTHHAPQFRHPDDMAWEMGRFRNATKFLFHPTPERPTTPNVGFLRYEPGAGFPLHKHDFAQIWYVIEGEFRMGKKTYGPGTLGRSGVGWNRNLVALPNRPIAHSSSSGCLNSGA